VIPVKYYYLNDQLIFRTTADSAVAPHRQMVRPLRSGSQIQFVLAQAGTSFVEVLAAHLARGKAAFEDLQR
jgi:hypothetical protein